jgi:hypothetical protein
MLLVLASSCGGETIDIGSNAAAANAPISLRCSAPPSAVQPPAGSSPFDGLAIGRRLMMARWITCPDVDAPPGLPPAFELSYVGAFVLKQDASGAWVRDTRIDVPTAWSLGNAAFIFMLDDSNSETYVVTFEEAPLRMFLATEHDPHTTIATYAAF